MADSFEVEGRNEDRVPPYYDREFIDKELSPKRIEAQGQLLLYRALNIGRAIAFVGSGISAAYGQTRWPQLIAEVGRRAKDSAVSRRASDELKSVAEALGNDSESSVLPLRAQVYRNLAAFGHEAERDDFVQRLVKCMTRDDTFTAYSAWQPLLKKLKGDDAHFPKTGARGVLKLNPHWHQADSLDNIKTLIDAAAHGAPAASGDAWMAFKAAFEIRKAAASSLEITAPGRASAEERPLIYLAAAGMADLKLADVAKAIRASLR